MYPLITYWGAVEWFPQQYAEEFYVIKGVFALVSTMLLIYHMSKTWPDLAARSTLGQRMRYYSLLAFSILVTGASAEQYQDGILVSYRNLGSLVVTTLLIVAMLVSIRDDIYRRRQ